MQDLAKAKYEELQSKFFKKGIKVAISSGICYGLYSAFLTLGMSRGVWADWFGPNSAALSAFVLTYVLGALGSAVNDTMGGILCLVESAAQGKLGDVARCVKTKPGIVMMLCGIIGGPISATAYVIGLQMAGPMVIPVTALCSAIGALLGYFIFKQELNLRMIIGIIICFIASAIIGGTSFNAIDSKVAFGCLIGFVSAFGWGIEGCVAGFGTSMIDNKIGVTIRQCTSGLVNMIVLIPILCVIAGNIGLAPQLLKEAYTTPAIVFFIVSGLFCELSYSLWYKGNAMCGAALGMTCNGAYSFWGPFFCWILMGVICKESGWMLSPVQWLAAVIMFVGIFLIAMNPLDLFKRKEN
ncbi:hypothetical protein C817_01252 [Dorea sp. 5-2]|nr:hypothetical protein C817_01252 [Dorea sp. 5-2]